ncbi:Bromodomain-containing protein, partial [Auriscalpium vulgare]
STFSVAQHKFAVSTIRTLKKLKDSQPFKTPVDPVTLNIPHYTTVITHPMDFSTVERKLAATNPIKPDLNADVPSYLSADEFIADVRLIFSNCVTFNGPEHVVTLQGKRVEAVFDKQIKQLPPPEELATPPPPPPPAVPKKAPRRPSTTVPVIRRNDNDSVGRPKREIHPPPPKDLPYSDAPKKQRKRAAKNDRTNEQLRFCLKVLDHLNRKQHAHVVEAFLAPVDWQLLNIPDYPRIIKKPMDLGTMRKKLENGDYVNAQRFHDDFQLMIRNCYTYNAAGTLVHGFAVEVEKLFNEKWKDLPPLHPTPVSDDDDDEDEDDSEDERRRESPYRIAAMEAEIRNMENNIAMLKGDTVKKRPKPTKKNTKKPRDMEVYSPPVASSSKASKKDNKSATKKKPGKKQPVPDDDALSFEQKKDLSEAISALDVTKLERVIQIIHEGVPEIRDSQEEIELEIDTLPSAVLTKLYNFVIRPLRQPPAKRSRPGKGTGTGGLKRKSMDENQEAEKIRALEERMKLFDQPDGHAAPLAATNGHDSEHSSDESSDDDSSESE